MARGLPQTVRDNLDKCRAAAMAGVDVYNRPGPRLRTANYIVLIIISSARPRGYDLKSIRTRALSLEQRAVLGSAHAGLAGGYRVLPKCVTVSAGRSLLRRVNLVL